MNTTHETAHHHTTTRQTPAQREDHALLLQSEFTAAVVKATGMHEPLASQIAQRTLHELRLTYGATSVYFPAVSKAERDAAIYREFNGTNTGEVCARHDISRSRLYQIVDEQRRLLQQSSPISSLKTGQVPA